MNRLETLWKYQELDLQMDQYIMEKRTLIRARNC